MVPKSNVVYNITYKNVYDNAYDNVSNVICDVISDAVSNAGIFNRDIIILKLLLFNVAYHQTERCPAIILSSDW